MMMMMMMMRIRQSMYR